MTAYIIGGLALLVVALGWLLARAYKANGVQKHRIETLEANVEAKDSQLKVMINARRGDGASALESGTF